MSTVKQQMRPKKPKKTLNQTNSRRNKPDKTTFASKTGLTTLPDNAVKARSGLLLYGYHSVIAALSNVQRDPIQLFATEEAADKLRTVSTQPLPPITCLSRTQLAQMLKSKQSERAILPHQGLILHTKPLDQPDLSDIVNLLHSGKPHRRFLILDQVTDPRNIGAILRSARAFGTDAIILPNRHAPDETGAVARAGADAGAGADTGSGTDPNLEANNQLLANAGAAAMAFGYVLLSLSFSFSFLLFSSPYK